jgi:hypothetical protein
MYSRYLLLIPILDPTPKLSCIVASISVSVAYSFICKVIFTGRVSSETKAPPNTRVRVSEPRVASIRFELTSIRFAFFLYSSIFTISKISFADLLIFHLRVSDIGKVYPIFSKFVLA